MKDFKQPQNSEQPENAAPLGQVERLIKPEYIVELYGGTQFLATWSGYPGRTCIRDKAKRYKSEHAAKCAIAWNKRMFPNRDFTEAQVTKA